MDDESNDPMHPTAESAAPGMPDLSGNTPLVVIEFGRPEWQSHLGGAFCGPEATGDIWWNWVSEQRCWCVLPELPRGTDFAIRLEAAPFAPYTAELRELVIKEEGGHTLLHRVLPCTQGELATSLRISGLQSAIARNDPAGGIIASLVWRRVPAPSMRIELNSIPLASLAYETCPDLQIREFLLRHELLEERNILYFTPGFGIARSDLGDSTDERKLSFRLFRLLLFPLD
jgi:hypothetical protein